MKDKKFEELMKELETIVKELENGDIDLEKSIEKYTEAMKLVKVCGDKLNKAVISVNKILAENGKFEDFKIENNH
ncbi:MAG: exodeoxyribonuclease VII small subunit [Bacilli bacterium]|nr:exodeoxyribonuclease VII small subunit [Bacilli bacterium]MDD3896039.1 exodeoxyribonuclease VII small subunit [Bacilli bacterium]MDD4407907.1 exodeoxyribonuclease VII small subunit [Bacilli bacterium]